MISPTMRNASSDQHDGRISRLVARLRHRQLMLALRGATLESARYADLAKRARQRTAATRRAGRKAPQTASIAAMA